MKRWAVLTVFLYALALIFLTLPTMFIAFANWGLKDENFKIKDALELYLQWGYWLWVVVMVAGQALLLLLPINIAERRLPARRPLKMPVIVSAFFLANLCFAGIFSVLCAIFTDNAFNYFDLFAIFTTGSKSKRPSQQQLRMGDVLDRDFNRADFLADLDRRLLALRQIRRPRIVAQASHALAPARQHP